MSAHRALRTDTAPGAVLSALLLAAACGAEAGATAGEGAADGLADGAADHAVSASAPDAHPAERELRVCADPNNLPFSNRREEGFENRIAELLAEEMGASLDYTWWAQRRGFIRNTLRAGTCDVVIGLPSGFELAHVSRPYYRSSYVFVFPRDGDLRVESFDDPRLREATIGVHLIGDDYQNPPPAHALASRGIVGNVRGFTVYGNYSEENPPARIFDALAAGEIDVAIVWGPLAGYFAPRQPVPLRVVPVSPRIDLPFLPFVFDIGLGVRRGDDALLEELEAILEARRGDVREILHAYGVPTLEEGRRDARR